MKRAEDRLWHKASVRLHTVDVGFWCATDLLVVLSVDRRTSFSSYLSPFSVKNRSPWANRLGLRKKPSNTAPFGATASC